jgi:type I restriction enzyme M protein
MGLLLPHRRGIPLLQRVQAPLGQPLPLPACLLILRKQRPTERRDKVLLIYAARHYRELSAQNELRPQDVMRMLVHYHAYGDASKVPALVAEHSGRIRKQVDVREEDELGRLVAEYQSSADKLAVLNTELADARTRERAARTKGEKASAATAVAKVEKQLKKVASKVAERDEHITEARRRADDDRKDVTIVGDELTTLYTNGRRLMIGDRPRRTHQSL